MDDHILVLEPTLDIIAAADLKEKLVGLVDGPGKIAIDASKVERIMTPCIQLIIAAEIELSKNQKELKLVDASDEFTNALIDSGLEKYYAKWSN